jgi:hypothetical protein
MKLKEGPPKKRIDNTNNSPMKLLPGKFEGHRPIKKSVFAEKEEKEEVSLKKKKNCIYFNRFGKCHRGDKCPFIHDRSRIAVCTQYVNEMV